MDNLRYADPGLPVGTFSSESAPQAPEGLADALLDAAEQVLGPAAHWQWRRQARQLAGEAGLEPWLKAAAAHLRVDCLATPQPGAQATPGTPGPTPGVYLWIQGGRAGAARYVGDAWQALGLQAEASRAGAVPFDLPAGAALYRVVPAQTFARLGWREFRQAALSDTRLLKEIGLATFVINAFALVIPLYMNAIYDRVLPAQAEMSLWVLSLGALLCLGLEALLRNERSRALTRLADEFQTACLPQLVHWMGRAPLSQALEWGQGTVRGLAALSRLRSLYWNLVGSSAVDLGFTVLYLAIIAWIGGLIALVPVAAMAAAAWCVWRYDRQLNAMGPDDVAPFSLTADRLALYRGVNAESTLASEYLVSTESMRLREQRRFALQSRCGSALALLGNAQTLLIVVVAYYLVMAGHMQPAGIFAAILLSGRMLQPLSALMTALPSVRQMNRCLRQVNDTLAQAAQAPEASGGMAQPEAGWSLRDVAFRYGPGMADALKSVSLDIRRGERVAIVGPTGSGKSTLVKLLLGVVAPAQGSIDWAGCPLAGEHARSLRDQTHYAWQSAEPIGASPLEYLGLEGGHSPEELAACARQVGLAPAIARWPQGLRTACAALPSLGRRTRELLALARLTLTRRRLLVLDTPSESLDPQSEQRLIDTLKARSVVGGTLLVVTDRANLLELVDRVIYLNQGQVRFDGAVPEFERLMAQGAASQAG